MDDYFRTRDIERKARVVIVNTENTLQQVEKKETPVVEQAPLSVNEIVLNYAQQKGMMLNADALELLAQTPDFHSILNELSAENAFIVSRVHVERKIKKVLSLYPTPSLSQTPESVPSQPKPLATEYSSHYRILNHLNYSGASESKGKALDFLKLFQDKYTFLFNELKNRGYQPRSLSKIDRQGRDTEFDVIVMVSEKQVTKNGHVLLSVEDLEGQGKALIPASDDALIQKAKRITDDDVIGMKCKLARTGELMIVKEFSWPDLPQRKPKTSEVDLGIVITSDIHIGSKLFLRPWWEKFISWMNRDVGTDKEKERVGKLKYLVIAGDCVAEYEEIHTKDGIKIAKNVKVDDLVLSYDFAKKKYVYKPITKVWDKGIKDVYRVHFRNGQWIDVTDEHNFLVRSSESNSKGYIEKKLKEIDLTNMYRRRVPIAKKVPYEIIDVDWLNEDLCFLLGHFLAEGWIEGSHVCTSGYDCPEHIIPLIEKNNIPFGEGVNGNGVPIIRFLKGPFKDFLKTTKKNSFDIHLPEFIFHLPPTKLQKIIDGYFLGDGNNGNFPDKRGYNSAKGDCYSTSSEQFARDFQRIGLQLGRSFHIWKQKNHNGAGKKPIYRITYNPNSHFLKERGYSGIGEVSISFIEKIGKYQTYDWEVKDTHNFVFKNGIITHNCVDGIGVYPNHINELEVKDIYEQYKQFEDYLLQLPDYLEIFITPGNHDPCRWHDPQPPVLKEMVPRLYNQKNIHFLPSPAWVEIEGQKTLIYHGSGLIGGMFAMNIAPTSPEEVIKELLIKRDLMSVYGTKHPYAPEPKAYMLVREHPDVYIGGDNHHNAYAQYRGTTIINNGCWQTTSAYAASKGFINTPGRVPQFFLQNATLRESRFDKGEKTSEEALPL